jgi:hypothetical protein
MPDAVFTTATKMLSIGGVVQCYTHQVSLATTTAGRSRRINKCKEVLALFARKRSIRMLGLIIAGSSSDALKVARIVKADSVMLDLEDSVEATSDAKTAARARVVQELRQGGFGNREVPYAQRDDAHISRVHQILQHTAWFAGDCPSECF